MKLNELFGSKSIGWEWEERGRDAGSAVFAIGDSFYRTMMQVITPKNQPNGREDLFLDVAFEAMRFDGDEGMSMNDVDASGYQFQVLSTVFEIVEEWFSEFGVKPIFAQATINVLESTLPFSNAKVGELSWLATASLLIRRDSTNETQ